MLRLLSDEDVEGDIIRGLQRRDPALDLLRVQDVGLDHTPDPEILEWAATEGRIVITEDVNSMVGYAWERVRKGQPMPGVIALLSGVGIGRAVHDVLLMAHCYLPEDMDGQVVYVPL